MEHERPFLFSGPLVLAILDGRKTVTRRLLAGSEDIVDQPGDAWEQSEGRVDGVGHKSDRGRWLLIRGGAVVFASRPTHMPGDGMWVREAWMPADRIVDATVDRDPPQWIRYRADGQIMGRHTVEDEMHVPMPDANWTSMPLPEKGWRPSIHLWRWASRVTRKVTRVVVERLQDITEEQARAEGVRPVAPPRNPLVLCLDLSYRAGFQLTWESINGKDPAKRWATNPLVVATTFEGP